MTAFDTPVARVPAIPSFGVAKFQEIWRRRRSVDEPDAPTSGKRVVAMLAIALLAYHYSLLTLIRTLRVETPLAYLGLVPVIALLLAAARQREGENGPPIHDRQVDYIIGIPLLLAAVAINLLLPVRLSTMFWVWRIDLLSFPLFMAGAIAVIFGVRTLWRLRAAVAFLILAWPLPYTVVLLRGLQAFTNITLAGITASLGLIPVAKPQPFDNSLFAVTHGGNSFLISVASACSGVNGMVGFLLIAVAFLSIVSGPRLIKLIWLSGGLGLLWVLNVARVVIIFAVGARWGEQVTIKGLHPYIGLIIFNLGVGVMLIVMRPLGLTIRSASGRQRGDGSRSAPGRPPRGGIAVPRARAALLVVGIIGLILALANSSLANYDLVATDLGHPRLAAFSDAPSAVAGWNGQQVATFDWAKRFFGESSTWQRYAYTWDRNASDDLRASVPVLTDVISTSDVSTFSTYGIEACYKFHGYKLKDVRSVDLGGGITGNVLSYYNPSVKSDWTSVYWYWPVRTRTGTRYERMVVMMTDTANAQVASPPPPPGIARSIGLTVQNALTGRRASSLDQRLLRTRAFLVSFSRALVTGHRTVVAGADG